MVGLVGPNGAGKTTTLRCLAGITVPTAGRIRIAGHDLATEPVAAKQVLAFIPDEPHLFEYLTVEEHLRFVGRLYGVADAPERIPRTARRTGARRQARRHSRVSSPEGCGRSWRSPAACCTTPRCCCSTSRSPASIRSASGG